MRTFLKKIDESVKRQVKIMQLKVSGNKDRYGHHNACPVADLIRLVTLESIADFVGELNKLLVTRIQQQLLRDPIPCT